MRLSSRPAASEEAKSKSTLDGAEEIQNARFRSRVGLLLGVLEDGGLALWSVPLAALLQSDFIANKDSDEELKSDPWYATREATG